MNISLNHVRNALSGFLSAYGVTAFLCFILLVIYWAHVSPNAPDPERGYIFPHNEHGAITYFNGFEATSCALLSATSIPLALLAAFIIPKRFTSQMRWEEDDPAGLFRIGSICGTIAAPVIIFILGPPLVVWLNAIGFAVGF